MLGQKCKNCDHDQYSFMTCFILSIFFTFIGHMSIGKASLFGRLGILFVAERSLKFMMKASLNSAVTTFPGL